MSANTSHLEKSGKSNANVKPFNATSLYSPVSRNVGNYTPEEFYCCYTESPVSIVHAVEESSKVSSQVLSRTLWIKPYLTSKTLLLGSLSITSKCLLDAVVRRVSSGRVPLRSLLITFRTDSRLSLDRPEPIHQILSGETESIASRRVVLNLKSNNNFSDPKL